MDQNTLKSSLRQFLKNAGKMHCNTYRIIQKVVIIFLQTSESLTIAVTFFYYYLFVKIQWQTQWELDTNQPLEKSLKYEASQNKSTNFFFLSSKVASHICNNNQSAIGLLYSPISPPIKYLNPAKR